MTLEDRRQRTAFVTLLSSEFVFCIYSIGRVGRISWPTPIRFGTVLRRDHPAVLAHGYRFRPATGAEIRAAFPDEAA